MSNERTKGVSEALLARAMLRQKKLSQASSKNCLLEQRNTEDAAYNGIGYTLPKSQMDFLVNKSFGYTSGVILLKNLAYSSNE